VIDGKPLARNGKDAGMIFFNDEGYEWGGWTMPVESISSYRKHLTAAWLSRR
jgi:hypothetical protein